MTLFAKHAGIIKPAIGLSAHHAGVIKPAIRAWVMDGVWKPVYEPPSGNDANTVMLLHFDGADGSTVFTDSSPAGRAVTRVSPTALSTVKSKFGVSSMYNSASGKGGYVSSQDFDFLDATFTVDFWVLFETLGVTHHLWMDGTGINDRMVLYVGSDNKIRSFTGDGGFFSFDSGQEIATATTIVTDRWYHMAITGSGNIYKFYLDGALLGSYTSTRTQNSSMRFTFGYNPYDTANPLRGYMDELRVSNIVRWAADFTPPFQAYGP